MELKFFKYSGDSLEDYPIVSGEYVSIKISELDDSDFQDDMYDVLETDNVFQAMSHYWSNSEISAIVQGETSQDNIWCEYRGYVFLFATFTFSSPDYDSEQYVLDVRCHFDNVALSLIDARFDTDFKAGGS